MENNSGMVEYALLRALATRYNYESYMPYVLFNRLLLDTQTLLKAYEQYYALYPEHTSIDFSLFLTQFISNWHRQDMNAEDREFFTKAIIRLQNVEDVDTESALLGLINAQLMEDINKLGTGDFSPEDLLDLIEKYEVKRAGVLQTYDKDCFTSEDVDLSSIDKTSGIPYAWEPLQTLLKGMVNGSLVVVNAAEGVGKTAFTLTQLVCVILWLIETNNHSPILFFNTEGTRDEVFGRTWSCLYKDKIPEGYDKVVKIFKKVQQHFNKKYGKTLYCFTANDMGINFIRAKVKKYRPAMVFLDMAAGIMVPGSKTESEAGSLKSYFNALRRISAENCPIWCTVQAGIGAKWWDKDSQRYMYKQWVDITDIYGSKSAVQGAAETIISIGRDNEHEYDRYIQTNKKKVKGKHVKFRCVLEEEYSNYKLVY